MLDRLGMIGEIREMWQRLNDQGRFAVLKEIMGDLDIYNFAGVPDDTILRVWGEMKYSQGR